jgi:CRISPR/Cas system-associated exonuclease Cas4 (RecB family)
MASKPGAVIPWTYTKVKGFDTCPKQFHARYIEKSLPFVETEATKYGNEVHDAFEHYFKSNRPLPPKLQHYQPYLDALERKEGEKIAEYAFGLTIDLEPCNFFDKNVWVRGKIDLTILQGDTAYVVDYKTSKSARYADMDQLELMAMAVFKHFPEVKHVKAALIFVVAKGVVKGEFHAADEAQLWGKWMKKLATMHEAENADVWNPKPSGLCRAWCDVMDCPHNGKND